MRQEMLKIREEQLEQLPGLEQLLLLCHVLPLRLNVGQHFPLSGDQGPLLLDQVHILLPDVGLLLLVLLSFFLCRPLEVSFLGSALPGLAGAAARQPFC